MADVKLVEVYKATNGMEAQVIRSLLDSYGIPSVLRCHAGPSILNFTVDGLGEVRIMVTESAAEEARKLINTSQNGQIEDKEGA